MEEVTIGSKKGIPLTFASILFEEIDPAGQPLAVDPPAFFVDLNLDQIIHAVTSGKQEYQLRPFFFSPLHSTRDIYYRQEVFKDLEDAILLDNLKLFAGKMAIMRRYLGLVEKLEFKNHIAGWFLEAALVYCAAVSDLEKSLAEAELRSRGLIAFRDELMNYMASSKFTSLQSEAVRLKRELSGVKYCVLIKGNWVRVRKYEDEIDYTEEVEKTFEKFKQGSVKNYLVDLAIGSGMSYVEAQILDRVAKLFPEIFKSLEEYYLKNSKLFLDETIAVFDREIQFYIAYLDYIEKIKQAGLSFCYPKILTQSKEVFDCDGFDLALANQRVAENSNVVCNDFHLRGKERIIVVSGPNQGGKTTFARMFGQLHYLANLGCPVPGREAQLYLFDGLFSHFEKAENIKNLRGKLQDDLVRIHSIMDQATPNSILILNEIFTSTTLKDAIFLSKRIMERIIQLDLLCVFVTFIDELASLDDKTISMVSTVAPDNPALRTFKIVRKPADGLSYAISIAEKNRVTYDLIKERIKG